MLIGTIPAGTGGQTSKQINLCEELQIVARTHGTSLHKILTSVAGKTGTHKDVQHIMHMGFRLLRRNGQMIAQCTRQI